MRDALEDLLHEIGGDDVKVFRQHRDLRFTHGQVAVQDPHLRDRRAGSTSRCRPTGLYAGTGYYRLERDQLERYREVASTRIWPRPSPGRSGPGWRSAATRSRPRRAAIRATIRRSTCCVASS